MPMMRNLLKMLLRGLAGLLFRVRVKGGLPAERGRLLVVANHESFLDGLLLGLFLPLDPVFVVHTGVVRNPVFRLLLGLVDWARQASHVVRKFSPSPKPVSRIVSGVDPSHRAERRLPSMNTWRAWACPPARL